MQPERRCWTILVYMAGDNGKLFETIYQQTILMAPMQDAGYRDIAEMEAVGSTDQVMVLVQLDTLSETDCCLRLAIQQAQLPRHTEEIPEQNTGDPCSLRDFIVWGIENYPAEHYAVVLWNHGAGWNDDDIYAFARKQKVQVRAQPDEVRSRQGKPERLANGLFLSSAMQVVSLESDEQRGICYDDSSMDFLDNVELQRAFREAYEHTGHKISVIGMDACLMNMIEVVYQLRDYTEYVVASQDVEPMDGWPYAAILQALTLQPRMQPRELADTIVQAYSHSFIEDGRSTAPRVTQSAVRTAAIIPLAETIGQIGAALLNALATGDINAETALLRAQLRAVRFADRDYADLHDFLAKLRDDYAGDDTALQSTLDTAMGLLAATGPEAVIAANIAIGERLERARGLSIYFPDRGYSPFYDRLDFATFGWANFICEYNKA